MHDLDTAQLRRLASESARRSQKQLRLALLTIHVFLYFAALLMLAVMVLGMPWVFDSLFNSIDLSLIIFGLFAGWFVGLALHGASVLVDSAWAERQLRQRAAAGVLGRALLDDEDETHYSKPKREVGLSLENQLSDDGELGPAEADMRAMHR
jgi:uncharacterized membrane protein